MAARALPRRSRSSMSSRMRRSMAHCIRAKARSAQADGLRLGDRRRRSPSTRRAAEQLLGGSLDGMQKGQPGKTTAGEHQVHRHDAPARNVVAAYIGSDPKLKDEWVAMGAHNDHVGIRAQGAGRSRFAAPLRAGGVSDSRTHRTVQSRESHLRRASEDRLQRRDAGAAGASRTQQADRRDPRQSRQRAQSERRHSRRLDQQRRRRRRIGQRDAAGDCRALREGEAEDEAVDALRVARRRREGTAGVRSRSPITRRCRAIRSSRSSTWTWLAAARRAICSRAGRPICSSSAHTGCRRSSATCSSR